MKIVAESNPYLDLRKRYTDLIKRICYYSQDSVIEEQIYQKANKLLELSFKLPCHDKDVRSSLSSRYNQFPFQLPVFTDEICCLLLAILWEIRGSHSFLLQSFVCVFQHCVDEPRKSPQHVERSISRYFYLMYGNRASVKDYTCFMNGKDGIWNLLTNSRESILVTVRSIARNLSMMEKQNDFIINQKQDLSRIPHKSLMYEIVDDPEDILSKDYRDAIGIFHAQLKKVTKDDSPENLHAPFVRLSQFTLARELLIKNKSSQEFQLLFSLQSFYCRTFITTLLLRFAFPSEFPCENGCHSCIFCNLKVSPMWMRQRKEVESKFICGKITPRRKSFEVKTPRFGVKSRLNHATLLSVACVDSLVLYSLSYKSDLASPLYSPVNISSLRSHRSFIRAFLGVSNNRSRLVSSRLSYIRNFFKDTLFDDDRSSSSDDTSVSIRERKLRRHENVCHPDASNIRYSMTLSLCKYIIRYFSLEGSPVLRELSFKETPLKLPTFNQLSEFDTDIGELVKGDGIFTLVHAMRLNQSGEISLSIHMCLVALQRTGRKQLQGTQNKNNDLLRISPQSFSRRSSKTTAKFSKDSPRSIEPVFVFPFDRMKTIDRADLALSLERTESYAHNTTSEMWIDIPVNNEIDISHLIK